MVGQTFIHTVAWRIMQPLNLNSSTDIIIIIVICELSFGNSTDVATYNTALGT